MEGGGKGEPKIFLPLFSLNTTKELHIAKNKKESIDTKIAKTLYILLPLCLRAKLALSIASYCATEILCLPKLQNVFV